MQGKKWTRCPRFLVELPARHERTKIKTDIGTYDISGKPAEEFPAAPELDSKQEINISAESFYDLIQKTSFAVGRDALKPALTGVLFRFNKEENDYVLVIYDFGFCWELPNFISENIDFINRSFLRISSEI